MDVKSANLSERAPASGPGSVGVRQRRALARLGLGATVAYVAPTLLALRSVAASEAAEDAVTAAA